MNYEDGFDKEMMENELSDRKLIRQPYFSIFEKSPLKNKDLNVHNNNKSNIYINIGPSDNYQGKRQYSQELKNGINFYPIYSSNNRNKSFQNLKFYFSDKNKNSNELKNINKNHEDFKILSYEKYNSYRPKLSDLVPGISRNNQINKSTYKEEDKFCISLYNENYPLNEQIRENRIIKSNTNIRTKVIKDNDTNSFYDNSTYLSSNIKNNIYIGNSFNKYNSISIDLSNNKNFSYRGHMQENNNFPYIKREQKINNNNNFINNSINYYRRPNNNFIYPKENLSILSRNFIYKNYIENKIDREYNEKMRENLYNFQRIKNIYKNNDYNSIKTDENIKRKLFNENDIINSPFKVKDYTQSYSNYNQVNNSSFMGNKGLTKSEDKIGNEKALPPNNKKIKNAIKLNLSSPKIDWILPSSNSRNIYPSIGTKNYKKINGNFQQNNFSWSGWDKKLNNHLSTEKNNEPKDRKKFINQISEISNEKEPKDGTKEEIQIQIPDTEKNNIIIHYKLEDSKINNKKYEKKEHCIYIKDRGVVSQPGKDEYGFKKTNQDSYIMINKINNLRDFNVFGVLDGHGPNGHIISQFISHFIAYRFTHHPGIKGMVDTELIYKRLINKNYQIIINLFSDSDLSLEKKKIDAFTSGTTCNLVFQIGLHIICASVGDSRAVIVYDDSKSNDLDKWKVSPLSIDHKPGVAIEMKRIYQSGGEVSQLKNKYGKYVGPFRVFARNKVSPGLAMSRSIGDFDGKKIGIISTPDIKEYQLNKGTKFLVICSDGIWDFLNNRDILNIGKKIYEKKSAEFLCKKIIKASEKFWEKKFKGKDDITVLSVLF